MMYVLPKRCWTLLIVLMIAVASDSFSQNNQKIELLYEGGPIYFNFDKGSSKKSLGKFHFRMKGDSSLQSIGKRGKNLLPYLEGSPEAIQLMNSYKTMRTFGGLLTVGSVLTFGAFAGVNMSQENRDRDGIQGIVLLISSVATLLVSRTLFAKSNSNVKRAVEVFNNSLPGGDQGYIPPFQLHHDSFAIQPALSAGVTIWIK